MDSLLILVSLLPSHGLCGCKEQYLIDSQSCSILALWPKNGGIECFGTTEITYALIDVRMQQFMVSTTGTLLFDH